MCVHLSREKLKFILLLYAVKYERQFYPNLFSREEETVHSLFVMKAKPRYEQCSIVNDREFENLIHII